MLRGAYEKPYDFSMQKTSDLPNISAPAMRAFKAAGITRMAQLKKFSEADLLKLHGVGPRAIRILRGAGAHFAGEPAPSQPVSLHPLITQLRFTRNEFLRSVKGVSEADARKRVLPMNCISWNVGHLAWQEQRYFLGFAQGGLLLPAIQEQFAFGCPASTPPLRDMLSAWRAITKAADVWLNAVTSETLRSHVLHNGKPTQRQFGALLQRTIYHYWYHTGENMAIRQMLGHQKLAVFVGNIDAEAPYQPEQ
jgi:hypothetical protein